MAFYLVSGDLVNMEVDCIVANANVNLKMVEGVTRAIFHKAGDVEMLKACRAIGHCDVGKAVMTPSFGITNTKAIIHAVGPNYINGKHGEEKALISAYRSVFKIMDENNFKSVAFPLLSSDFNYPIRDAYKVARKEIKAYLSDHLDVDVYMVIYYKTNFDTFDDDFRSEINNYASSLYKSKTTVDKNIVSNNKDFVKALYELMDKKKIDENTLTLNANLEYKYLDRLKNDETFIPSKDALLSMAVALELKVEEVNKFLGLIGYVFSINTIHEIIVRFFIERKEYSIYRINDFLFYNNFDSLSHKVL